VDLSAALGESLRELELLPVEIRHAKTGELLDRVLIRSLEQKLRELGGGEWLVTVALPSGKKLSMTVKTDSAGRIDTDDLARRLANSAGEMLKAVIPTIAHIGREVGDPSVGAPLSALQNIDWKNITKNLAGLAVDKVVNTINTMSTFGGVPRRLPRIPSRPAGYPTHGLHRPDARLCFFRGSVLNGEVWEIPEDHLRIERFGDATRVSDPDGQLLIVQVLRPDAPASNFLLPRGSAINLARTRSGAAKVVDIAVTFGDPLTDNAVSLRAGANLPELQTIAGSLTAEDVQGLQKKPEGAAVCLLYLILRTRDADIVEGALQSLPGDAREAPDVAVVRAELAARHGDHKAALATLLEAANKGLPWFGQGVSYMANRLRLYERMEDSGASAFADHDPKEISLALQRVEAFSTSCDYSAPVTTYSGPHPTTPGTESLTRAEFLATKGFPISP
jgi:hypothetical protein